MAKRKDNEVREVQRYCSECALGKWDMTFYQLGCTGKPYVDHLPKVAI